LFRSGTIAIAVRDFAFWRRLSRFLALSCRDLSRHRRADALHPLRDAKIQSRYKASADRRGPKRRPGVGQRPAISLDCREIRLCSAMMPF